jgi:hypothetical protein
LLDGKRAPHGSLIFAFAFCKRGETTPRTLLYLMAYGAVNSYSSDNIGSRF